MLNELPMYFRHKNVLTSMLWYGQSRPDMTLLLSSFVLQMETLASNGVTWKIGTEIILSKGLSSTLFGTQCLIELRRKPSPT
ncbi:hypothetical protein V5799_013765 [Amblyomma americanum]|uniref:Uncharacterized protein n=1 Tax=Amblyomma americanum TaxID=6943 RepID=A0AAQ4E4Y2_AMBAM